MTNIIKKVIKNGTEYQIFGTAGANIDQATSSTAGVVKLGSDTSQSVAANAVSTTSNRTYAIQTNGSGQMVVNVPWDEANTKTFYLTGTTGSTNIATAQAAYDRYKAGKTPIIQYSNRAYILYTKSSTSIGFRYINISSTDTTSGYTYFYHPNLSFTLSSDTVTAISTASSTITGYFLRTGKNYSTPYTPEYDGSPATKKYVDDRAVPTSGTTGYVLTKTSDGYGWAAASGGDVIVSSQANNILTSGMKIWAGTQANYDNLGTYDNNTIYLTI